MQIEEKIAEKIVHTKTMGKRSRRKPQTRWIDKIRKDIEMRGKKLGKRTRKQKVGE